jgi:hypothetical protein
MFNMGRITLISFFLILPLIKLFGQSSSTAAVCVNIIDAVGTSKLKNLHFRSSNINGESSTLEIKAAGSKKGNGDVDLSSATDNGMALLAVRNNNMAYSVTLPKAVTIEINNSKERIIIGAFNFQIIESRNSSCQFLAIGATLYTGSCQVTGEYVALTPLIITVNYN